MPRWVRFLSCSFTGLLLALTGFFLAAYWWEGGAGYWQAVITFMSTPAFWYLAALSALLVAVSLFLGRLAVYLYGLPNGIAGLLAGFLVAAGYTLFLLSAHAESWGGMVGGLQKNWPSAAIFALPFTLSAGFTGWLWDRLD